MSYDSLRDFEIPILSEPTLSATRYKEFRAPVLLQFSAESFRKYNSRDKMLGVSQCMCTLYSYMCVHRAKTIRRSTWDLATTRLVYDVKESEELQRLKKY